MQQLRGKINPWKTESRMESIQQRARLAKTGEFTITAGGRVREFRNVGWCLGAGPISRARVELAKHVERKVRFWLNESAMVDEYPILVIVKMEDFLVGCP